MLQEPSKSALLEYEASGRRCPKPSRRAHCIVQLPAEPNSSVAEVLVDLSNPTPAVLNWVKVIVRDFYQGCSMRSLGSATSVRLVLVSLRSNGCLSLATVGISVS